MASQMDMFLSEPEEESIQLSSSCPISLRYTYGFVILFNWDEGIQKPFKMFPRRAFSKEEISDKCYNSRVSDTFRVKKLKKLRPLPGKKVSLFAKVEGSKY